MKIASFLRRKNQNSLFTRLVEGLGCRLFFIFQEFHKGLGMMAKIGYSYDTTKFFEVNMPIVVVIYLIISPVR